MNGQFESMESPKIELLNLRNAFRDHVEQIREMQSLCARAADALWKRGDGPYFTDKELAKLIAELKKAAQ